MHGTSLCHAWHKPTLAVEMMIIRNCTTKAQKGPQTTGIIG